MSEDLRRRLQSVSPPGELDAERRAWAVVRGAYEEREPVRRSWRPRGAALALAALVAAAAIAAALALTPAGSAFADWVRSAVGPGEVGPALDSLPAPGLLLVTSEEGSWVVKADGSKRRLGAYVQATWSPNAKFVGATDGSHVVALEPDGDVRWTIPGRRVADVRWMPGTGIRVAYRAGTTLRVVVGNGTGDHLVARPLAPVAPAWRPVAEHVLTYADPAGRVHLVDADTRRELWRTPAGPRVLQLAWSTDAERLLVVSAAGVRIVSGAGRLLGVTRSGAGLRAVRAAFAPRGHRFALLRADAAASEAVLLRAERAAGRARVVSRGLDTYAGVAWSPDGRWLLAGWPSADQWLFLPVDGTRRPIAVGRIAAEFAPGADRPVGYPRIEGWCCPS